MKNSITKVSLVVSIISLLVVGFLALQMHEQVSKLQNVQQQVDDNTNVTDPRQTSCTNRPLLSGRPVLDPR